MKKLLISTAIATALISLTACDGPRDNSPSVSTAPTTADKVALKIDDASIVTKVNSALVKDPDLSALKINVDSTNGAVSLRGAAPSSSSKNRAEMLAKGVANVKSVDNQLVVDSSMTTTTSAYNTMKDKAADTTGKIASSADSAYDSTKQAVSDAGSTMKEKAIEAKDKMSDSGQDTKVALADTAQKVENSVTRMGNKAEVKVEDATITTKVNAGLVKDPDLSALKINVDTNPGGHVLLKGTAPSMTAKTRATEIAKSVEGVTSVDNQLMIKTK